MERIEGHAEWGEHDRTILDMVDRRFVLRAWGASLVATVLLGSLVTGLVALVSEAPVAIADATVAYGSATVVFALTTFVAFAVVLAERLERVRSDVLVNGLAVGALHAVAAMVVAAIAALAFTLGFERPGGTASDLAAMLLSLVAQGAPAALFGCLLAIGIAPNLPHQAEFTRDDHPRSPTMNSTR